MTHKHAGPEDLSMWDDPQESPSVRQLLRAGRLDQVDYDLDAGLARHLANLQSGAPLPAWAVAQSTVQKGWSLSLLAWLLPPMISATVVGAWIYFRPAEPSPAQLAAAASAPLVSTASASPARENDGQSASATAQAAVVAISSAASMPEPGSVHEPESSSDARARVAGAARSVRHGVPAHRVRPHSDPTSAAAVAVSAAVAVTETKAPTPTLAAQTLQAQDPDQTQVQAKDAREPSAAPAPAPAAPAAEQERRAEPAPQPRATGVSDARLEREMQMLAVAQRILTSDPERSLRLTRQGEQEFHRSMFSAERTQVSLLALVQLGRLDEARRLGAPFLRAYPNAPWSARLREALATGHLPPVH